ALTQEYKRLIKFRNGSNALRNGELASYSSDDVCAFIKTAGKERVLVLANLRNASVSYDVPAAVGSTGWRNAFDGQPAALNRVTLQPYQYLVLKK
ncbi:MAG: alpha-glucosidase C-terminal domain-containing protein, partial [Bacteroidota bacterium]|nr:alpha-glucosidase C-terminal domain-containing protein [Bacteroidota bacterium]